MYKNKTFKKLAVLFTLILVTSLFGAVLAATVTPTLHEGNDNPANYGLNWHKFDPPADGTYEFTVDDVDYYITVEFKDDGHSVDWESNFPIHYVLVKGGDHFYEYYYGENGAQGDTDLIAPDNAGGNQPQISHVSFIWEDIEVVEYGDLIVKKIVYVDDEEDLEYPTAFHFQIWLDDQLIEDGIALTSGQSFTKENLPVGTYTVKEIIDNDVAQQEDINVIANDEVTVTFLNYFTTPEGNGGDEDDDDDDVLPVTGGMDGMLLLFGAAVTGSGLLIRRRIRK